MLVARQVYLAVLVDLRVTQDMIRLHCDDRAADLTPPLVRHADNRNFGNRRKLVEHVLDFRRIYATILDDWLGLRSTLALGGAFESLPLFRA